MFNFVNNLNYLIFYNDLLQNITIIINKRYRNTFKRRLQNFFYHKIKFLKICFLFVIFKSCNIRDSILNFLSIKNKILTILNIFTKKVCIKSTQFYF